VKRPCRQFLGPIRIKPHATWQEVFPHARIVTDPKKLAQLEAAVAMRKQEDDAPHSIH
jgi:hypothetical protein